MLNAVIEGNPRIRIRVTDNFNPTPGGFHGDWKYGPSCLTLGWVEVGIKMVLMFIFYVQTMTIALTILSSSFPPILV